MKIAKPDIGVTKTHFHTLCCYVRLCLQVDTPSSPRHSLAGSGDSTGSCHWCIQDVDSCRVFRTLQVNKINLSTTNHLHTCDRNTQTYLPPTQVSKGHHLIVVQI